jgi:predicted cobalt transporter CbtA
VFSAALVVGLHIVVLITGLQALITTPMILHAETFEITDPAHGLGQVGWKRTEGVERVLYALLANCGAGVGFAPLLVVGLSFDFAADSAVRGVIWGTVGFRFFTLAGSLGLPHVAPGILVPDEQAAQIS